ncbi:hypothetical protein [Roseisolibacter sp. H3M3-2]|uniref:hypothetical protein n=1 Tax=Roseisolibacter sp. H3M3-2 TaxID=3031323 RepID=UPI0023D9E23E|nr:hypothetical protein [Roseisolibacter sp. H3M3-2]MDF1501360.1 hypothetical protein [Roseisolibacter sp. H3M3-2]
MSTEPARPSQVALPTQPVRLRQNAISDRTHLRVTGDAATKENAFPSSSGHASGMSNLQTQLRVEAWVRNLSFVKSAWLDVHVFDRDGRLLTSETLPLRYTHAAGDGGDLFVFDGVVYQGSVATQGSVDPRPDARALQYRLYCEQGARVYTDGLQHWCELRTDAAGG